jgi:AcrR family transcriptional regulator
LTRVDRKARILQAARSVFSRKGYRAATVGDILDEARVARGTFYRYFPDKRQVFYELVRGLFNGIYEASSVMLTEGAGASAGQMHDGFAHCYRIFIDNKDLLLAYLREGLVADPGLYSLWDEFDRRMTALFARVLSAGVASGAFRPVDEDLVSRAMLMLFLQVPYRDIMMGGRVDIDVDVLASEMVGFVLEGLGAHGGYLSG